MFSTIPHKLAPGLLCINSYVGNKAYNKKPLFLYHPRRTGGMTFFNALRFSFYLLMQLTSQSLEVGRIEQSVGGTDLARRNWAFIATHEPFGLHREFSTSFNLAYIVRDPFERITSHYTYDCMRSQTTPSLKGFEKFIAQDSVHENAVKQLCGERPNTNRFSLEEAERNLEEFHSVVTTQNVQGLTQLYLSFYQLPNVVMEKTNTTLPEYKFATSSFREEVYEKNPGDLALFRKFEKNPKVPHIDVDKTTVSNLTLLIWETEKLRASETSACWYETEKLIHLLAERATPLVHLSELDNRAPA